MAIKSSIAGYLVCLLAADCRDGSLARWLVEYEGSGNRLLKAATYEHYPLVS
jgi:hypothetical protein